MVTERLVVATFNVHAGIDGYGRRFDLTEACRAVEADVLVLQETFSPIGAPSAGEEVASALGYRCLDLPLARAWRLVSPRARADEGRWEPRRPYPGRSRALRIGDHVGRQRGLRGYEQGTWGIAVLTRLPIVTSRTIELGRLRRDVTARAALAVTLSNGIEVVGTHMAHSTHGSPLHLRRLRQALPAPAVPAVLCGDMNFWGPPLEWALPGWTRAVKAKTWPAWRPLHQVDHVFVTPAVTAAHGAAVRAGNSDHLPLRAELFFEEA